MNAAEIQQALKERFGDKITGANLAAIDPWVEVAPAAIREVSAFLKSDPALSFDALNDLCGVDYFEPDPKKAPKAGFEPHLEVVYHLYSYIHRHSLVVKVKTPRWMSEAGAGEVAGKLPEVPSVASVWAIADWHEREAYDLVGIHFTDHPNLRRILCPEDWVGHPLRKDYEFPLEYHGVRAR